jgi:SH3-like domain-containing protein
VTYLEPSVTEEPENDISELNPTFADVTKQVVVVARAATIRTSTVLADNNGCAWPQENRVLDVTGESENWYRVDYNGTPCYIAKTVVADYDVIQAFTPLNDEVEISESSVNVRSYPSTDTSLSIRGQLAKGTKVTRVAVSDKWSRILFEVTSETETDESGNAKVEIKQYYVSNDCITSLSADTATETDTDAESATEAAT